MYCSSILPQCF
uniref:Uncharacterized protein n=1 Tax=Arundo donax TaxID=35708 RepID=A0A0A9FZR8_ARUDO